MKFNWGTGILIFLILFLSACAVFIVFAMRQDVNLVHDDYYEKGVDYTNQMEVEARSIEYFDSIQTFEENGSFLVQFEANLALSIDSGNVLMFRPSSSSLDLNMPFNLSGTTLNIPREDLVPGRYILKLSWFSGGLEYQVDKTISIH
jgi:hypothetical protein